MMDRALSFSLSAAPRLCRHILVGCNMLEKEDEMKSKNPFRLWFLFASSIFQVSAWSLLFGISGEYWRYWSFWFWLNLYVLWNALDCKELLALKLDQRGYNSGEARELRVVLLWPVWLFINHCGHKGRIDLGNELMLQHYSWMIWLNWRKSIFSQNCRVRAFELALKMTK